MRAQESPAVRPFSVSIDEPVLAEMRARLARTRWPDAIDGAGWAYGTDETYLRELVVHWRDGFDWRAQEQRINGFEHAIVTVDGLAIHTMHARSSAPDAIPLLMLHGWPSTFVQMLDIVPLLTPYFHVVVPSLPGFGFSPPSRTPGMHVGRIAGAFVMLMASLGYARFGARSSDLGAGVLQQMALDDPGVLIGLHLSGTNPYIGYVPDDLSPAEQTFVADAQRWNQTEMAYAMMHSSKPQTVAVALNDSPAGLASWIVEKFWRWSDDGGDLGSRFTFDQLLTNLTIYWATQTINSSMRLYYETARATLAYGHVDVPTAMLMSDRDLFPTPREWAARQYNVVRWTKIDRGGHFLEWEEPRLVADDLIATFAPARTAPSR
ncbi:multidrug MFS transporter [Vulcanimicrobium alpinum]|uniref:Multidrug MFS transporter n=1 Tax=Vulcanimicrobium alpinum TaxID=3016050 RepID=A0AAN2C8I7_UNVUL|nr:epoxide hydrolase family protein [Vulcanimicrobium alpinum]BDE05580.1 multidrug MFS transporter [Vulcanimicrobium alpinum]